MLKSIRRFEKKVRADLLAELALNIGGPVFISGVSAAADDQRSETILDLIESIDASGKENEVQLEILREILQLLKVSENRDLLETKTRILEFIGKEIRDITVGSNQIASVRKRLGQKGMLPPSGYKITYTQEFSELCQPLGINRQEVRQVVSAPDTFEHFLPEIKGSNDEAISLYAKAYRDNGDAYSLLIDTRRVGDEVIVHYGIRVFHSDVDMSDVTTPLDLLRAFTARFGEDVVLNDEVGRLFIYRAMPIGATKFRIGMPNSAEHADVRASHRLLAGGVVEVTIAYGVNLTQYAASLRRHGVAIKRPGI